MIRISKASLSDLQQITPLFDAYRVFYKQESNLDGATEFLKQRLERKESTIFFAHEDGQAMGFTQIYPLFSSVSMQRVHLLNDLYVDSNHRGKGIATLLLNMAKQFAIDNGSKGLSLETHHTNPAQALYERLDWEKDEDHLYYFWKA